MKRLRKRFLAIFTAFTLAISGTTLAWGTPYTSHTSDSSIDNAAPSGYSTEVSELNANNDEIIISYDDSYSSSLILSPFSFDMQLDATELLENDLSTIGVSAIDTSICADGSMIMTAKVSSDLIDSNEYSSLDDIINKAESLNENISVQPNYYYELFDIDDAYLNDNTDLGGDTDQDDLSLLATTYANDPYTQTTSSAAEKNQYWGYSTGIIDSWRLSRTEKAVTIAIFDAGIMMSHEDLASNILKAYAYDAYNQKQYVETPEEIAVNKGHGTHVAGIAAASANNNMGIAGASYNANILPIKVNNGTSIRTSTVVTGYRYMMKLAEEHPELNIKVANMSLGATNANDQLLHDAIIKARNNYGIVTVCAGGNGKDGVARTEMIYPSDYKECISVTALTSKGYNCIWSDYNAEKDISAPGEAIFSTLATTSSSYGKMSGTSMASPMVAGTIALLMAAVPHASIEDILAALYESATPISDPINDRSNISGTHGALNASKALDLLLDKYANIPTFSDVSKDSWYFNTVESINKLGVMTGIGNTKTFQPASIMTRAQVAEALYKYLGKGSIAPSCNMPDVNQNEWYAKAINWAVSKGFMKGYTGGEYSGYFGTHDQITREQIACVIASISGDDLSKSNSAKFLSLDNHEKTSFWAVDSMIWAVDNKVINGANGKDLNPGGLLARCEMAQVLLNTINAKII